jgi:hypothetical protein
MVPVISVPKPSKPRKRFGRHCTIFWVSPGERPDLATARSVPLSSISKQRNAWLQTMLIKAAKLAPRWNPELAALYAQQLKRGHPNRATLQEARKLVAYLLAVDKSGPLSHPTT